MVLMVAALLAMTACSPSAADWTKQPETLVPDAVSDFTVAQTPAANTELAELVRLAPGVTGAGRQISSGADEIADVFVLSGPKNSLNSVTLRIAESLGAADNPQTMTSGDDLELSYSHSASEVAGVQTDSLMSRTAAGEVVDVWQVARPVPERMVLVHSSTGNVEQAQEILAAVLDSPGGAR